MCKRLSVAFALVLWPALASAQIGYGTIGVAGSGTTAANIPYPASIAAGDLLVVCVANKYPTNGPTEPSGAGFAAVSGGQGTGGSGGPGVDSGDVYATIYVKVATGGEAGNLALSVPSGNVTTGYMARYTKTAASWAYAATNGSDNVLDVNWSVTGAADPGVASGDMVIACSAKNVDSATFSGHTMSQAGVTYAAMNERADGGSSFGDDVGAVLADAAVSSGTSSGVPSYTATVAGGGAAGATVMLRIREVSSGGCTGGFLLLGVGKC